MEIYVIYVETELDIPVVDNHMHLSPDSDLSAVEEFSDRGGTHLLVVNLPSWNYGIKPTEPSDYDDVFRKHLEVTDRASDILPGEAYPVLGVHPVEINDLADKSSVEEAKELMKNGLEKAAEYIQRDKAVSLKSGRPHFDVSQDIWNASNEVMRHCFSIAEKIDCAVQLHTEKTNDTSDIASMANEEGMDTKKVVKHYAEPGIEEITQSVLSKEKWIKRALENNQDFLMETDFLDDPERPGAVMVPKTVPKRVEKFIDIYRDELYRVHVELPREIYGIEIN